MKNVSIDILHYLTLLTTCLTLITIMTRVCSLLIRITISIQNKIESLRVSVQIIITQIDSLNSFLINNYNLDDRISFKDLVQSFVDRYEKSET